MEVHFRGTVTEEDGASRYAARMELTPSGLAWLYSPLDLRAMRRQDSNNMRLIKQAPESRGEMER
jgi:hypothetical protein